MFFQIKHTTRYNYSVPVFCEPLTIRLRPREDPTQRLCKFKLDVWPEPAGVSEHVDLSGNGVSVVWFHEPLLSLSLTTSLLCETRLVNPYHFILDNEALTLPLRRPVEEQGLLAYYLREDEPSAAVTRFAEMLAAETELNTVHFLGFLARTLYERTERLIRETGEAWTPERTLTDARGSCRDLAVLFNACCRAMGIAARFVSGYAPAETHTGPDLHLHAWSEVFLPGAGWRGFDPSRGLATADQHVAVAAGRTPREAAPTQGVFRSSGAKSQLQTQIAMHITGDDPRQRLPAA